MGNHVTGSQDPPGIKLEELEHHDFVAHREHSGAGQQRLRGSGVSQPRVLRIGDVLSTGEMVIALPRRGENGIIFINLKGERKAEWVPVLERIPIAIREPHRSR